MIVPLNNLPDDAPYLLHDPVEQARRIAMLTAPHMQPLTEYLAVIKKERGPAYEMPHFDPCDGGINARALFLLEAPGPKAVSSTFISRNNPDPTAQNLWHLMNEAKIPRPDVLLWNIVPWYVGTGGRIRAVNKNDLGESLPYLQGLIRLLPGLNLIVLVGKKAQAAHDQIRSLTAVPIMATCHMSQRVFAVWPEKKRETQEDFHNIARFLKKDTPYA